MVTAIPTSQLATTTTKKTPTTKCTRARPAAVSAAAVLILALGLCDLATATAGKVKAASGPKEVVTNQFHVLLKRSAEHPDLKQLADDIAKDHGFHNLGHVSTSCFHSYKWHFTESKP